MFAGDYVVSTNAGPRQYHVDQNGRFLMIRESGADARLVLVQNWDQELKRLVPPSPVSWFERLTALLP